MNFSWYLVHIILSQFFVIFIYLLWRWICGGRIFFLVLGGRLEFIWVLNLQTFLLFLRFKWSESYSLLLGTTYGVSRGWSRHFIECSTATWCLLLKKGKFLLLKLVPSTWSLESEWGNLGTIWKVWVLRIMIHEKDFRACKIICRSHGSIYDLVYLSLGSLPLSRIWI